VHFQQLQLLVDRLRQTKPLGHQLHRAAAAERVAEAASAATGAEGAECGQDAGASGWAGIRRRRRVVPHAPRKLRQPRSKYSWAELMRRVYAIDVLVCP
jgi:hypothetical protein